MRVVGKDGASLVEALVALLLGLFVVHLGLATLEHLRRHQARTDLRLETLMASRAASTVLRGELQRGWPGRDWILGPDSLALRAFRGTAVVCASRPGPDELVVAYTGDRLPDLAKDSVEVVGAGGALQRAALLSVTPAIVSCPRAATSESVQRWRVDAPALDDAVLARVYESGSYHLVGSALRYRIGAGGRQPLTPAVWRDAGTGLLVTDSTARLELEPRPGRGDASSAFLVWIGR